MANNLVVQLLLKTGTFSNDLKTAKGQIQNFQQGCNTASKSLTSFGQGLGINVGTLTKFGGAVGVAMAAGKEFKAILESSQTTSDAFHNSIAGAKGIIDQFNTAIATADFTLFNDGLWGAYEAAKAVAEAMDQLSNTQLAFDYMSKVNQTKFNEAYNVWKNPKSTKEMKDAAVKQMKEAVEAQWEYARNYNAQAYKGYVAQVVKEAGEFNLPSWNVNKEQFKKAMEIDLSPDPAKERKRIESQYNEYLRKLNEYKNKDRNWFNSDTEPEYNNISAVNKLKKEYADVIAIRAMLKLMSDDELKGLAGILQGMESVTQQAQAMEKQYNRVASGEEKVSEQERKRVETKKEELKLAKDSLADLEKRITETTKLRDAEVAGTDEWVKQNNLLNELNEKLKKEKEHIDEINASINRREIEPLPQLDSSKLLGKAVVQGPTKYNANQLRSLITFYQKLRDQFVEGSPEIERYNKLIAELQERLNAITNSNYKVNVEVDTESLEDLNIKAQNLNMALGSISSMFGSLSTLASSFGDTTGEAFATVFDSIGLVAQGIQQFVAIQQAASMASGVASASGLPFPYNLAAIATVVSTIAGVFAKIISVSKGAGKFADGGIVGGNSFSGDKLTANVNSGEMILNRAQQANLFRQINTGGMGDRQVEFHISGTELVGVLNNNMRKQSLVR